RLSLKIGYYLTDVSGADWGNTLLLPGSHLHDELDCPNDGVCSPAGAVPLRVPAGAALILDRRLWHSRSPNFGPHTRKVIWVGYAYRWLRPKDDMAVRHLYDRVDPVRRQLLVHQGLRWGGDFVVPRPITTADLLRVHSAAYLRTLRQRRVLARILEVPVVAALPACLTRWRVLRPMRLAAGGTLLACRLALER